VRYLLLADSVITFGLFRLFQAFFSFSLFLPILFAFGARRNYEQQLNLTGVAAYSLFIKSFGERAV